MNNIQKIFLINNSPIIREGLKSIISSYNKNVKIVGESSDSDINFLEISKFSPDIIIVNYDSEKINLKELMKIKWKINHIKFIGVIEQLSKQNIEKAICLGIKVHLTRNCDQKEISNAIDAVINEKNFLCATILNILNNNKINSCDGIELSKREYEILKEIANGFNSKKIASKLFISTHTVLTHRKNIMSKLGVNNIAQLIMYAIKENILPKYYTNNKIQKSNLNHEN